MIARRGGRAIEVDGHALLWWVRRSGLRGCQCCDECWVVLASATRTGSLVRVHLREVWREPPTPITPGRIAALARKAIARGWVPGHGSGEFAGEVDEVPPHPGPRAH